MAYQTIPPSGGGTCASDPWGDAAAAFVAEKVSTLVNVCFRSYCATAFTQEVELAAVTGAGATVTQDVAKNGGVYLFDSGTTGSSYQVMRNKGSTAAAGIKTDLVANLRTSKWAKVVRAKVGTVGAGAQMDIVKLSDELTGDVILGVLGSTSTTNWLIRVTGQADVDTGVAFGATYMTVALIADGTDLKAWNVDTGVQMGASASQVNCIAAVGHIAMLCTNSAAASNTFSVDDIAVITEVAT